MSTHVISLPNGQKMNWPTTVTFALFHIGAIAALFMFSWKSLIVAAALYWITVGLGHQPGLPPAAHASFL